MNQITIRLYTKKETQLNHQGRNCVDTPKEWHGKWSRLKSKITGIYLTSISLSCAYSSGLVYGCTTTTVTYASGISPNPVAMNCITDTCVEPRVHLVIKITWSWQREEIMFMSAYRVWVLSVSQFLSHSQWSVSLSWSYHSVLPTSRSVSNTDKENLWTLY